MKNDSLSSTHVDSAIHNGDMYYQSGFQDLNSTDEFFMQVKTPSTGHIHLFWEIDAPLAFETYLYEGATEQTDGTIAIPSNANRDVDKLSGMVVRAGVSSPASTGTTIDTGKYGTDTRKIKSGGELEGKGLILKPDTVYIRKFKSNADSNTIAFKALWIEE